MQFRGCTCFFPSFADDVEKRNEIVSFCIVGIIAIAFFNFLQRFFHNHIQLEKKPYWKSWYAPRTICLFSSTGLIGVLDRLSPASSNDIKTLSSQEAVNMSPTLDRFGIIGIQSTASHKVTATFLASQIPFVAKNLAFNAYFIGRQIIG